MSDALGSLGHQSINHLLSDSPWEHQDVLTDLSIKTSDMLSDTGQEVGLLIDEVGFRKKGRHSACVGRQYLGCIGKHDNGQVAVVAGLSSGKYYCPIDVELFMPECWEDDHARRKKAKIPESVQHLSKPDMARAMITSLRKKAVRFDYVAFDALYGNSFDLLSALNTENILFVGDVRDNVKISLEPITYSLPAKPPHSKGRKFKHKRVDQNLTSVSQYCRQLGLEDFKQLHFRDGTKQKISAYFHQKQVYLPVGKQQTLHLQLIIRKDLDGTIKYSLTNMKQESLLTIAKRQGQRVFVEKIFEEGKNQIGMGDYQVRSWAAFHRHMTLCFLAFYYMTYQKIAYQSEIPLTAPIIRKLVASTIMSRWETLDTTIELCLQHISHYHRQILMNLKQDCVT